MQPKCFWGQGLENQRRVMEKVELLLYLRVKKQHTSLPIGPSFVLFFFFFFELPAVHILRCLVCIIKLVATSGWRLPSVTVASGCEEVGASFLFSGTEWMCLRGVFDLLGKCLYFRDVFTKLIT
jgi:hypothetical protein